MEEQENGYTQYVGLIAGVLTAISLMPPLIKLIKDKKADQVPLGMLVILLCGVGLWIYYGFLKMDWPIILTNSFSVIQNITMIILRHKYKNPSA